MNNTANTEARTQADVINLCKERDLSIECVLKYAGTASVEAPAAWWKALDEAGRLNSTYAYIDQWSDDEAKVDHLRLKHDCWAWAGSRSHAVGMQLAAAIKSEGAFA